MLAPSDEILYGNFKSLYEINHGKAEKEMCRFCECGPLKCGGPDVTPG